VFGTNVKLPAKRDIPSEESVSDEELVALVRPLYGRKAADRLKAELANCDAYNFDAKKKKIRTGYLRRRGSLACFMQELKLRFCLRCSSTLEFGYAQGFALIGHASHAGTTGKKGERARFECPRHVVVAEIAKPFCRASLVRQKIGSSRSWLVVLRK